MALISSTLFVYFSIISLQGEFNFVGGLDLTEQIIISPSLNGHSCQRFDENELRHLGTKTPYRVVANVDETPPTYEGCSAISIAGVVRHGTRTPGVKDVDRMRKTLSKIKSSISDSTDELQDNAICQNEKDHIINWELNLESEEGKTLTKEGEDEMFKLAQRYQKRYPSLLPKSYSNSTFLFKFTKTQRTEKSAKYFSKGLFGNSDYEQVWFPEALDKDPVLRFYKLCKRWIADVKNSESSKRELNAYKNSDEALAMVRGISKHLRLNYTLSYDEVNLMYVTCAFEVAWHKERKSPWCAVFSNKDIQVLEYGEELKYYWRDGYGFDVNYRQACVLTRDILDRLESNGNGHKATFYFTHSGTLLKLLSRLGLYKDPFKLNHDVVERQRSERSWKVSYIDAFGTNVVFVLYRCSTGDMVLTLHQERIVRIPGCPAADLCPVSTLRRIIGADSCKYGEICNISQTGHDELFHEL